MISVALIELVANLATTDTTSIDYKFDQLVAELASVTKLATRVSHLLQLKIVEKSGIRLKGHQVVPLALLPNLSTRLNHLHCHIALDFPIGIIS